MYSNIDFVTPILILAGLCFVAGLAIAGGIAWLVA